MARWPGQDGEKMVREGKKERRRDRESVKGEIKILSYPIYGSCYRSSSSNSVSSRVTGTLWQLLRGERVAGDVMGGGAAAWIAHQLSLVHSPVSLTHSLPRALQFQAETGVGGFMMTESVAGSTSQQMSARCVVEGVGWVGGWVGMSAQIGEEAISMPELGPGDAPTDVPGLRLGH